MLKVDAVSKRYRSGFGLGPIDLELKPGLYGLLGPNGAGKTTLLRMLASLLRPDAGTIVSAGHDPNRGRAQLRAYRYHLGYMPQEPSLERGMRVADFLTYIALLKEMGSSEAAREVDRVLEIVDLRDRRRDRLRDLSGGMRKRVTLAQALLGKPTLVVLDEPAAELDPRQRLRVRDALSQLSTRTVTLISSHQTADLAASTEELLVLLGGRLSFRGRPEQLAAVATGRVWRSREPSPRALVSWRQPDGTVRNVGSPPNGALPSRPTVEDGYLLLQTQAT